LASRAREKIWVVRPGDGTTLADVLSRLGDDPTSMAEGRVFVGKRRATRADQPIRPGDTVRIGPRAAPREAPAIQVLFEREGIVATVKPAGIPTVPDHGGASHSFVALVAAAIGARPDELRVTSRLDREVSGVVLFARGDAAEARLRAARAEGRYRRRYVAIASGELAEAGTWDAPIGRAENPRLRAAFGPDAKDASTRWARMATVPGHPPFVLLAVDPLTGRTHQIRIHASHAGAPLVGDADYGGPARITLATGAVLAPSRIALHAARISVPGDRGTTIEATAPIPAELADLWAALGGAPAAWEDASRVSLASS
jgi:RluA family pseudouridine synthase